MRPSSSRRKAKKSIAADRASLVARGYDAAKLAQYERDGAAGRFSPVVVELLTIAAGKASVPDLDRLIGEQVKLAQNAPSSTHSKFYWSVVDLLRSLLAKREGGR